MDIEIGTYVVNVVHIIELVAFLFLVTLVLVRTGKRSFSYEKNVSTKITSQKPVEVEVEPEPPKTVPLLCAPQGWVYLLDEKNTLLEYTHMEEVTMEVPVTTTKVLVAKQDTDSPCLRVDLFHLKDVVVDDHGTKVVWKQKGKSAVYEMSVWPEALYGRLEKECLSFLWPKILKDNGIYIYPESK